MSGRHSYTPDVAERGFDNSAAVVSVYGRSSRRRIRPVELVRNSGVGYDSPDPDQDAGPAATSPWHLVFDVWDVSTRPVGRSGSRDEAAAATESTRVVLLDIYPPEIRSADRPRPSRQQSHVAA
jgi:hypothetical protein